ELLAGGLRLRRPAGPVAIRPQPHFLEEAALPGLHLPPDQVEELIVDDPRDPDQKCLPAHVPIRLPLPHQAKRRHEHDIEDIPALDPPPERPPQLPADRRVNPRLVRSEELLERGSPARGQARLRIPSAQGGSGRPSMTRTQPAGILARQEKSLGGKREANPFEVSVLLRREMRIWPLPCPDP